MAGFWVLLDTCPKVKEKVGQLGQRLLQYNRPFHCASLQLEPTTPGYGWGGFLSRNNWTRLFATVTVMSTSVYMYNHWTSDSSCVNKEPTVLMGHHKTNLILLNIHWILSAYHLIPYSPYIQLLFCVLKFSQYSGF